MSKKLLSTCTILLVIILIICACGHIGTEIESEIDYEAEYETELETADYESDSETELQIRMPVLRPNWQSQAIPGFTKRSSTIVLAGEVEISDTGIIFCLENTSFSPFWYGSAWDLAFFDHDRWYSVDFLPRDVSIPLDMRILEPRETRRYEIDWSWRHGSLPPGHYMFARDYFLYRQPFSHTLQSPQDRQIVLIQFAIE